MADKMHLPKGGRHNLLPYPPYLYGGFITSLAYNFPHGEGRSWLRYQENRDILINAHQTTRLQHGHAIFYAACDKF